MRRIAILWLLLFFCLTACGHINGYFKQSPKILQDCAINLITMNVPLRIKMLEKIIVILERSLQARVSQKTRQLILPMQMYFVMTRESITHRIAINMTFTLRQPYRSKPCDALKQIIQCYRQLF